MAGRRLAVAHRLLLAIYQTACLSLPPLFFCIFWILFTYFFWYYEDGPGILVYGVCTSLSFFEVAPTLGWVKSSIPHGAWRFHFFPNSFKLKSEYIWTFISIVGIFVS
jgi:hypothetical protein